jgi:hypothetical protein
MKVILIFQCFYDEGKENVVWMNCMAVVIYPFLNKGVYYST